MSDHGKKAVAPRVDIGSVLSADARALITELQTRITVSVRTGTGVERVEEALSTLDADPYRRKAVSPANQYNDNVTYVDHNPYNDGYADSYNDGRAHLKQGS